MAKAHYIVAAVCVLALLGQTVAKAPSSHRRLLSINQRPGGGCACPRIYAPVCAADGQAYNNKCEAECRGLSVSGQRPVNGICNSGPIGPVNPQGPGFNPSGPASSRPWIQQIGPNPGFNPGSSNGNGPAGTTPVGPSLEGGPTRPGRVCACPLIYAPVCGADGRSYPTKCAADCIGVRIASQGNC